ncbi:MAG: hypothetical protein JXM70_29305 [Pirellulales bacterium]|nr:hypothetical protein [Pirellulales bacterium]
MSKFVSRALIVGIACLFVAGYLWAKNDPVKEQNKPAVEKKDTTAKKKDTSKEKKQTEQAETEVWVGITVYNTEEETEYLIGTIDASIAEQIELDEYDRRFIRISNLRIQEELENSYDGKTLVHYDCADKYDWGVILIQYEDIASIEFKKGDPLAAQ